MNFITHYAVSPQKESPLFTFGCLLPDLYRGFSKDFRQFSQNPTMKQSEVYKGMLFHLQTDKVFHNHAYFIAETTTLTQTIRQQKLVNKHAHIVAHVFLELLLDHHILQQNPTIFHSFYGNLNRINTQNLQQELLFFYNNDKANKIIRIFKSFKSAEYAQHLSNVQGILSSLQHILGTKFAISFEEYKWIGFIEQNIDNYNGTFENFINDIKLKLYNA